MRSKFDLNWHALFAFLAIWPNFLGSVTWSGKHCVASNLME